MTTEANNGTTTQISADELRNITSFQDALNLISAKGIETVNSSDVIGDGFTLLESKDKERLVGVPFLLLSWRFAKGNVGEFVSAHLVTTHNEKFIINDGSTGIMQQLADLTKSGVNGGIACKRGLRKSEYEYTDPKTGEVSNAVTYYIA